MTDNKILTERCHRIWHEYGKYWMSDGQCLRLFELEVLFYFNFLGHDTIFNFTSLSLIFYYSLCCYRSSLRSILPALQQRHIYMFLLWKSRENVVYFLKLPLWIETCLQSHHMIWFSHFFYAWQAHFFGKFSSVQFKV